MRWQDKYRYVKLRRLFLIAKGVSNEFPYLAIKSKLTCKNQQYRAVNVGLSR